MAVGAGADEKRRRAGRDIPRRHPAEMPLDFELALRGRQVEKALDPLVGGNVDEQVVDRSDADLLQHQRAVGTGMGQIAHQKPSTVTSVFTELAMKHRSWAS